MVKWRQIKFIERRNCCVLSQKRAVKDTIVKNKDNCLEYPWEHTMYEENIRWAEEELKKLKENKNE